MKNTAILYPLFAQVTLVFIMLFWMGIERIGAIRKGQVKASDIARRNASFPEQCAMVSNNYHNQFEFPVLFYLLVPLVMITNQVDMLMVGLAWVYVGIRYIHAYIHTKVRSITKRFFMFMISCFVLLVMWLLFAGRIILSSL
ncbi:MAG: MAPEG family protein [Methyloligellaceae bacterium]